MVAEVVQVEPGMKIWRQLEFHRNGGVKVLECNVQPSRSGQGVVFKAAVGHGMARDQSMLFMEDCTAQGIVCIAPEIPENATHYFVRGMGRGGKVAFVTPVVGPVEELLDKYKRMVEVMAV